MLLSFAIGDFCANTRTRLSCKAQSSSVIDARMSARTIWRASHHGVKLIVWEQTGVGRNGKASARSNVFFAGSGRRFCRGGKCRRRDGLPRRVQRLIGDGVIALWRDCCVVLPHVGGTCSTPGRRGHVGVRGKQVGGRFVSGIL